MRFDSMTRKLRWTMDIGAFFALRRAELRQAAAVHRRPQHAGAAYHSFDPRFETRWSTTTVSEDVPAAPRTPAAAAPSVTFEGDLEALPGGMKSLKITSIQQHRRERPSARATSTPTGPVRHLSRIPSVRGAGAAVDAGVARRRRVELSCSAWATGQLRRRPVLRQLHSEGLRTASWSRTSRRRPQLRYSRRLRLNKGSSARS